MTQFECISPVDGAVYVQRDYASSKQIAAALERAESAQHAWQQQGLASRQALCRAFLAEFAKQETRISEHLCWQMGRPVRFGAPEVRGFLERGHTMIDLAPEALADITLPYKPGFQRYIKRVPLGVALVIAPWNYPYLTAVNAMLPALLAGNTVVLKHSTQTPLCAELLGEVAQRAGFPPGVLQTLHLDHQQVAEVVKHPAIAHIAFTGSVSGGQQIEHHTAALFKHVGLELGGKDPAFVRADADLAQAVETVIDGAMFNSGQSCCGIERAYVHASVYDEFVARAEALVKQYVLGRPDDAATTLGPMVSARAASFVRAQISEACSQGARGLISEAGFEYSRPETAYLAPQLLVNVHHGMRVMTEETFGPVLGIQVVRSDDEALALMNDSAFGLTAAIFSRDLKTAAELGARVQTGTVFVNRCDYLDPELAWTGVKHSGRGCTLSRIGFEHLTRPQSFHIKEIS